MSQSNPSSPFAQFPHREDEYKNSAYSYERFAGLLPSTEDALTELYLDADWGEPNDAELEAMLNDIEQEAEKWR